MWTEAGEGLDALQVWATHGDAVVARQLRGNVSKPNLFLIAYTQYNYVSPGFMDVYGPGVYGI